VVRRITRSLPSAHGVRPLAGPMAGSGRTRWLIRPTEAATTRNRSSPSGRWPAPLTRLGKSWIRSAAGGHRRLSAAHHRWQVDVDGIAVPDEGIDRGPGIRVGSSNESADLRRFAPPAAEPIAINAPHPGRVKRLKSAVTDRQPQPFRPRLPGGEGWRRDAFGNCFRQRACGPGPVKAMHFHRDGTGIKRR